MHEHAYDIEQLIFALSEIPASDPLVQLPAGNKDLVPIAWETTEKTTCDLDPSWNALLKTAGRNKREADLNSLCLASGCISWEYKGKTVHSPVVLLPVDWKILKGKQQVELRTDRSAAFLNPFVRHHLVRNFGSELAEAAENATAEELLNTVRELIDSAALPATIAAFSGIGNFHHHRYQILRELELIRQADAYSPLVQTILGNEAGNPAEPLELAPGFLSPADADQLNVFTQLQQANTVIQGPPGTGKSQVLTNLIGKSLVHDGFTLVVSEKRVALEVLVAKLSDSGLDAFAFTAHSRTQPKDFIQQLKTTWQLLEQDRTPAPAPLLLSEQLKDALQLLLDKLNSPTLVGGVSFSEFRQLAERTHAPAAFSSDVPTVRAWLDHLPQLATLEQQLGSFAVLQQFKHALIVHPQFDQMLRRLQQETETLCSQFSIRTFGELEALYKSVARCQLVANEAFRSYFDLHRKPRERRRFDKIRLQFIDLSARLAASPELKTWKSAPSRSEAASWLNALDAHPSWLKRRKLNKTIAAALSDPSTDPRTALKNRLAYLDLHEQLLDVRKQLAEWGIERPETALESAAYVLRQLEQEDANELNRVAALSANERRQITAHGERLKQLVQDLNRYRIVTPETELLALFDASEHLIESLLNGIHTLRDLPDSLYRLLSTGKPLAELQATVLHSNLRLLETRFPELAAFDGSALEAKLNDILATEQEEFSAFAQHLLFLRKQRFDRYAALLRTPAAQLKGDDKTLKARLKSGKAILVREFGKSKQHLTVRELLSGDARTWIELLTPVWLSTPAQIGKTFPMEQELFRLAIFDEASQIPLPNALGALQRAKRAVVAGDEQQMAPTSYFSGAAVSVDLLHQATWYWKKVPLKHHYRSEHPALIAFSNTHFYGNELVAYPAAKAHYPLFRHFVKDAVYDDRVNTREAKAVADFLEKVNWKKSLGIVAFSEQQLECIWQSCSAAVQEKITAGQENNTVFFKALEQVQGDEADNVVIGLGYAKNADGAFHLRFGPLNQSQGHKRLNVLLTRAKSELHFFTSVEAADFAISANESVNLLRLFLSRLEQPHAKTEIVLPYGLITEKQAGSALTLREVWTKIPSAQELVTFHRVMGMRGWRVGFE